MHLAPSHAIAFDMMLLRMYTFIPAKRVNPPVLAYEEVATVEIAALSGEEHPQAALIETATPCITTELPCPPSSVEPLALKSHEILTTEWSGLLSKLNLTGLTLSAAENAEFIGKKEHQVHLRIEKGHKSVFTPAVVKRIEQALSNQYQEPIQIVLECTLSQASTPAVAKRMTQESKHQLAEAALQTDPFFQQLQQEFSAELVKSSIVPLEDSL
jgi:DNA polymerase-3 subunit gamma/tau